MNNVKKRSVFDINFELDDGEKRPFPAGTIAAPTGRKEYTFRNTRCKQRPELSQPRALCAQSSPPLPCAPVPMPRDLER